MAWTPKSFVPDATTTPQTAAPEGNYNREQMMSLARGGVRAVPDAMTALGAISGTPAGPAGQIIMGGLGRAGGEGIKQLLARIPALEMGAEAPQTAGDAYGRMEQATRVGSLMETLGLPISWGIKAMSKPLAEAGSGSTKALREEFPDVSIGQEMLDTGVNSRKSAEALRAGRSQETDQLISQIDQSFGGPHISDAELSKAVLAQAKQSMGHPLTANETARVIARTRRTANALLSERRGGLPTGTPGQPASTVLNAQGQPAIPAVPAQPKRMYTLAEVKEIAQDAQDALRGELKASAKGAKSYNASPSAMKSVERGATSAKNDPRFAGVTQAEQATRRAIALARAMSGSEAGYQPFKPSLIGTVGATAGSGLGATVGGHFVNPIEGSALGGLGGFLGGNVISAPPVLRGLAFAANSPITQQIGQQGGGMGIEKILEFLLNQAATPGGQ